LMMMIDEDWRKLLRKLKHLKHAVDEELSLGADEGDGLLTVQADMKSLMSKWKHCETKKRLFSI